MRAQPERPSSRRHEPEPAAAPVAPGVRPETEEKRRWGLTAVIVVMAAGAAAARGMRRNR
ncbi:MAG TPA: hypothetical protein VGP26_12490 [Actinophytocola sp.]|nr:hypothetical protein [Actinophytocola sp.]